MDFHFFGHGKVMENQCWKRGGPLIDKQSGLQSQSFHVMILNNFDTLSAAWQCVTPLWSIKLIVVCQTLAMQLISPSQWLVKSNWSHVGYTNTSRLRDVLDEVVEEFVWNVIKRWNSACDAIDRENFRAVFQLLDNYCFVLHPLDDYSVEVPAATVMCHCPIKNISRTKTRLYSGLFWSEAAAATAKLIHCTFLTVNTPLRWCQI